MQLPGQQWEGGGLGDDELREVRFCDTHSLSKDFCFCSMTVREACWQSCRNNYLLRPQEGATPIHAGFPAS